MNRPVLQPYFFILQLDVLSPAFREHGQATSPSGHFPHHVPDDAGNVDQFLVAGGSAVSR